MTKLKSEQIHFRLRNIIGRIPTKEIVNFFCFTILATISAILVYPPFLVVLVISLVCRKLVQFFVQWKDPNHVVMLNGCDAYFAAPDPYENMFILLSPYFTFPTGISKQHIVKVLNDRFFKHGIFPELQQRIVKKCGYYFRYNNVNNFNAENHVIYLHPECPDAPVKIGEVRRYCIENLTKAPFNPNWSPWELILVPNLIDEDNPSVKSGLFLRANHCLMDGLSMINFLKGVADVPWQMQVGHDVVHRERNRVRALWSRLRLIEFIMLVLTWPYFVIKNLYFVNDKSEFLDKVISLSKQSGKVTFSLRESETRVIPEMRLKALRTKYKVGISSLLYGMAIESVVRFIKRKCDSGFSKIPESVWLNISVPIPGHPDAMTNHWSVIRMKVPVNKDRNDSLETVKTVHALFENFKGSAEPLVNFATLHFIGLLPAFLFPKPDNLPLQQTIALTNMPCPKSTADIFGYVIEGYGVLAKPPPGTAFGVGCHSQRGKFWIDIGGVSTLFDSQEELKLLENITFDVLTELEDKNAEEEDMNFNRK